MAFIKCDRIFTEQVRTACRNVSDADVDTIIKTHFADWFSQNVSIITYSFLHNFNITVRCIVLTKTTCYFTFGALYSTIRQPQTMLLNTIGCEVKLVCVDVDGI